MLTVAVTEPRFTAWERDLLLASRRADNAPRGRHGHLISEATDPATQGRWTVDLPTRDFAQEAIDREQTAYRKRWGDDADMDSLLWRVTLAPQR